MSHSPVAPHDAERWFNCSGSVTMQAQFPEVEGSEVAEEGNAAHWIGAEVLSGRGGGSFLGRKAPNGVIVNEDMVFAAMRYVEHIASIVPGPGTVGVVVEKRVDIKRVHPQCFGTPDAWYFDEESKELHVFDLKYGFGVVDPVENKQLICYALGILELLATGAGIGAGIFDQNTDVCFHIVQPRASHRLGPVRLWSLGQASNLRSWANQLEAAAAKALSDTPQCVSGEHCRYCSALHACATARQAAYNAIDVVGAATPDLLSTGAEVSEYLALKRAESAIKNLLSAREGGLIAKIQAGESVRGLVLDRGQGRLSWDKPVSEIIALGDMLGKDLRAEPAALTPAKAKQKGIPADVVAAYSSSGGAGLKLLPAEASLASQAFRSDSHEE